jgi:hypothetical protein
MPLKKGENNVSTGIHFVLCDYLGACIGGTEEVKVIIAGSRTITSREKMEQAIAKAGFLITEVVCGGASGVDELGRKWAFDNNIRCSLFPADWERYKKAAGPLRNRDMAAYADALIAVWNGKSRGTRSIIEEIKRLGKPFWLEQV